MRDQRLAEIGLTPEEFVQLKEEFSILNRWEGSMCCFGSLAYCCMRQGGCSRRDIDLVRRYPNKERGEIMAEYFRLKRQLARILLTHAKNQEKVQDFIEPE
jgi:predicted metal-binding transcription factor (methanogenesis marker protein 9)